MFFRFRYITCYFAHNQKNEEVLSGVFACLGSFSWSDSRKKHNVSVESLLHIKLRQVLVFLWLFVYSGIKDEGDHIRPTLDGGNKLCKYWSFTIPPQIQWFKRYLPAYVWTVCGQSQSVFLMYQSGTMCVVMTTFIHKLNKTLSRFSFSITSMHHDCQPLLRSSAHAETRQLIFPHQQSLLPSPHECAKCVNESCMCHFFQGSIVICAEGGHFSPLVSFVVP